MIVNMEKENQIISSKIRKNIKTNLWCNNLSRTSYANSSSSSGFTAGEADILRRAMGKKKEQN